MLHLLNKNIVIQWVIFLLLLAFSVFTIITKTEISTVQGAPFLFIRFSRLFSQHVILGKGLIITVLLVQIILLQYFFAKNEFSNKFSLLPACYFLSILLLTKSLIIISPFFFTILFLLSVISINFIVPSVRLKNNALWIGVLIALSTSFDQSGIILFIVAISSLIINQFSRLKEIGIMLLAFTLVYFYFFSYYFLTDQHQEWFLTFQQIKFFGFLNNENPVGFISQIAMGCLSVLYLYFLLRTRLITESKVVSVRKRVLTLNICSILILGCLLISNSTFPQLLGYLFVPISIYLGMLAQEKNLLYINEIVTVLTLVSLCL